MKRFEIPTLIILLLSGCTGVYNFNTDVYHRKVVVASFLHPDSLITVSVSWNRPVEEQSEIEYIDGAMVQIEEDGVLVVQGATVHGVFSSQVYPIVGKHYRLIVRVNDELELSATTSVPLPADIRYSVREKMGTSRFHEYIAVDVSNITLPHEAPAVWISGYMKYDNGYIDDAYAKDLYANSPYLDQFNTAKDAMDALLRESNTIFERGFIRIQHSALSLALPFTFSMWTNWVKTEYVDDDDGTLELFAAYYLVHLTAPSEEYDRYKRSAVKQDLTYGSDSPFVNDPVSVFSNIRNGTGIFAGYNTSVIAVPVNNPYK